MKNSSFKFVYSRILYVTRCNTWKSPDEKSEKEILKVGHNKGAEWGDSESICMKITDGKN